MAKGIYTIFDRDDMGELSKLCDMCDKGISPIGRRIMNEYLNNNSLYHYISVETIRDDNHVSMYVHGWTYVPYSRYIRAHRTTNPYSVFVTPDEFLSEMESLESRRV